MSTTTHDVTVATDTTMPNMSASATVLDRAVRLHEAMRVGDLDAASALAQQVELWAGEVKAGISRARARMKASDGAGSSSVGER